MTWNSSPISKCLITGLCRHTYLNITSICNNHIKNQRSMAHWVEVLVIKPYDQSSTRNPHIERGNWFQTILWSPHAQSATCVHSLHTHTHTHTHTQTPYTHTYTHTPYTYTHCLHIHTHTQDIHTHTLPTHTHILYTHTYTPYTHTQTHTHTLHTHTHTLLTHTHTSYTYTHTRPHTHTHTHTLTHFKKERNQSINVILFKIKSGELI